jgi:ferredoxin-type protein NapF
VRGDGGFPEVSFGLGECTFCAECASACRDNVFQPPPFKADHAWPLGAEILPSCLSLNAVVCRSCAESCPVDAIEFRLRTGGISEPQINLNNCVGCGACYYICPNNSVVLKYNKPIVRSGN